ncbi:MAG: alkaline phosphatase family protein [Phycisphaeraceae bacterium]
MQTSNTARRRVLMIGLDAATAPLIEQMMEAGELPNLQRLRDAGSYGRLESTSRYYVSSVWPSFAMGAGPEETGCYHYLQWNPRHMKLERIKAEWMRRQPFWRTMAKQGRDVIALDVPYVTVPDRFGGIELSGWGTHDLIFDEFVDPPELRREIVERFGESAHRRGDAMEDEKYQPEPLADRLRVRDQLLSTTKRLTELGEALLSERPWDFALLVLGGPHRGGHLLWDSAGISDGDGEETDAQMQAALRQVYRAADVSVGQWVDTAERVAGKAGQELVVFAFALHGMGPNYGRTDILPDMLDRVIHERDGSDAAQKKKGLTHRVRQLLPNSVRYQVKSRLPYRLQDALAAYWRLGGIDWSNTPAVSVTADVHGYVRINLKGRERDGIVEPGAEYDALCEKLREGLLSFRDLDTSEPVAQAVHRTDELVPDEGRRDCLPDLVVQWSDVPCAQHRAVVSDRFGRIDWPAPNKVPNGRSGNHKPDAFVIARGGGFVPGGVIDGAHMLDLPPTAWRLLGLDVPAWMRGQPIEPTDIIDGSRG